MSDFFLNLIIPMVLGIVLISIVYMLVRMLLDIFRINLGIVKLILFFGAYYYIGAFVLTFLEKNMIKETLDIIRIIYTPIQYLISLFS